VINIGIGIIGKSILSAAQVTVYKKTLFSTSIFGTVFKHMRNSKPFLFAVQANNVYLLPAGVKARAVSLPTYTSSVATPCMHANMSRRNVIAARANRTQKQPVLLSGCHRRRRRPYYGHQAQRNCSENGPACKFANDTAGCQQRQRKCPPTRRT
jgi:hypothetical protein